MLNHNRISARLGFFVCLIVCFQPIESVIVPEELPTILSLVYANLPPIKKGTDSRLGFGFRLGEHADFQVLLELGPQRETMPLGDKKPDNNFNKRQVSKAQQKALWRQQYRQQFTSTERSPISWLESWSKDMSNNKKKSNKTKSQSKEKIKYEKFTSNAIQGVMPVMPLVPNDSLRQLQMLYQMAATSSPTQINSTTTTSTMKPFQGGPLNLGPPAGFIKSPPNTQLIALLQQRTVKPQPTKSQSEITKELMDVSLEPDEG